MKEKLLNNLGLKLIAVILAVLTWGIIVNITDPATDRTITGVTVHMLNEDALINRGYTYEILEGSKIAVVVKGPTQKISSIAASDIYATADFSTLSPVSDYVNIQAVCTKQGLEDYKIEIVLKTQQVKLNIENRETKNFDVAINLLGNPASGYAVGNSEVSPMSVRITGAESIVERIESVVAEYDIEGASFDIAEAVKLKLYDAEGALVDDSSLTFSRDSVRVKIPILIRKVVPVSYATAGAVNADYEITDISPSITEIEIAGTAAALAPVTEIVIPADKVDVSNLIGSKDFNINIGQFVPTNVKILSSVNSVVSVTIDPLVEQKFDVMASSILLHNRSQNLEYEVTENVVSVIYRGVKKNLEKIADNKIIGSADMKNLEEGNNKTAVIFPELEGCVPVGECFVNVNVSLLEDEED